MSVCLNVCVRLVQGSDRDAVSGFEDEIRLLTRLRGRHNIVQLMDFEV